LAYQTSSYRRYGGRFISNFPVGIYMLLRTYHRANLHILSKYGYESICDNNNCVTILN
jgi:hypothetical protein